MAIEVFPDSPNLVISPRISFSHDLSPNNIVPVEKYLRSNNSSIDFDFCVFKESFGQDSSTADELFSDGKILPIQIRKPQPPPPPPAKTAAPAALPPPASKNTAPCVETRKPISESEEKHSNKSSFWGFKRSTSLNGGSGYGRGLCPLPLLSRSNSTGSNANAKRTSSMKQSLVRSSSCSHQKPPLKKSNQASYCYGVKIHPVLNVPPANLFGLGSIFNYSGTNKSKKK